MIYLLLIVITSAIVTPLGLAVAIFKLNAIQKRIFMGNLNTIKEALDLANATANATQVTANDVQNGVNALIQLGKEDPRLAAIEASANQLNATLTAVQAGLGTTLETIKAELPPVTSQE